MYFISTTIFCNLLQHQNTIFYILMLKDFKRQLAEGHTDKSRLNYNKKDLM